MIGTGWAGPARAAWAALALCAGCVEQSVTTRPPLSDAGHLSIDDAAEPDASYAAGRPIASAPAQAALPGARILADQRAAPAPREAETGPALAGPPVSINLTDVTIAEAAQVILGDVLSLPFVVDPGVEGAISLRADDPIPRAQLLETFSAALAGRGYALLPANGVWRISAEGAAGGDQRVFLPRHVAAAEIAKALELAVEPGQIRVVEAGGAEALVVRGRPEDLALAARTVEAVDRPALAGMSLMLVGLAYAPPGEMASELGAIFGGDAAPGVGEDGVTVSGGGLRVVPLDRLGAVALLARDGATLDRAFGLVRQLDQPRQQNAERLFIYRVQNRSAENLATALTTLFAQGPDGAAAPGDDAPRVVVDAERNALVISAPSRRFQQIVDLIRQLDAAPVQVLVEATILEVTLNDSLRFGVQFAFESGSLFGTDRTVGGTLTNTAGAIAPTLPGFAFSIGTAVAPNVIIDALDEVTDLRVVSSPKLLVRDNQSATLQIGDQVPIATRSSQSVVNPDAPIVQDVEYRDTGVTLTVTPRVNAGGFVSMDVAQEVSAVAETTTSGIDSPTISRRSITTNVTVRSGQTVVLGGLIQDRSVVGRSGIPVAVDLPVVGPLFGRRNQSEGRSELLALLRPHILSAPGQAADLTERLRRDFDAIAAAAGEERTQLRRPGRTDLPTFED